MCLSLSQNRTESMQNLLARSRRRNKHHRNSTNYTIYISLTSLISTCAHSLTKMSRLLFVVAVLVVVAKPSQSVPSCATVVKDLTPCLSYLKGQPPSPECCAGVKALKDLSKTKADLVAVCKCCKDALSGFTYDPKIIPALPQLCGVPGLDLPPIDKNYNCDKIQLGGGGVFDS